jgi:hypothetical protein
VQRIVRLGPRSIPLSVRSHARRELQRPLFGCRVISASNSRRWSRSRSSSGRRRSGCSPTRACRTACVRFAPERACSARSRRTGDEFQRSRLDLLHVAGAHQGRCRTPQMTIVSSSSSSSSSSAVAIPCLPRPARPPACKQVGTVVRAPPPRQRSCVHRWEDVVTLSRRASATRNEGSGAVWPDPLGHRHRHQSASRGRGSPNCARHC